jgi:sodium-dependent dicarboxylate transporter 2/3/5
MFPCKDILFKSSGSLISEEIEKLGTISKEEKRVLIIFAITVFLWITRTIINSVFPGLKLSDTIISLIGAVSLFVIPMNFKKGNFILEWSDTQNLAWGILILFGGGLALAKGMASSGLVALITDIISAGSFNILLTVSLLIILMLFMTELMSNVALVAVLAPVVAGIAVGLNIPVLNLLIPVTMASSCAFMLPMATPPNAIVFASGYVKVNEMAKAGIILNFIAVGLLILYYQFVIPIFF